MRDANVTEPFMLQRRKAERESFSRSRAVRAGMVAGQVGGLTMGLTMMFIHFALGKVPFLPFQAIGASMLAMKAASHAIDLPVALLGLVVHELVPSLVWGIAFGVLVTLARPGRAVTLLFLGLAMGALAQVIDVYVVLPCASSAGIVTNQWSANVHPFWSWFFHLSFGLGLSLAPWKYDPCVAGFV
jgi:hypothetical protein